MESMIRQATVIVIGGGQAGLDTILWATGFKPALATTDPAQRPTG